MTACNLIVQSGAAYLLTDTACYLEDGTLTHFQPKVLELTHAIMEPASMAFTGELFPQDIAPFIEGLRLSSATELLRALPDIVREGERVAARRMPLGRAPKVRVKVAHWNLAARRADGHIIGNDAETLHVDDRYVPFEVRRVGWDVSVGSGGSPYADKRLTDPTQFNPETEGAAMLEWEREYSPNNNEGPGFGAKIVGGEGLLTRVKLGATDTWRVCSWNDAIGQRIAA